jgi:23S rRNA pseudouridine2605 synthase
MDHADDSDQNTGPRQEKSPEASEKTLKAGRPADPSGKKIAKKPDAKGKATPAKTERIAKVLARAGLASRREVERLIGLGKIAVNGRILDTPAVLVSATDVITVDGQVIGKAEATRLWRYHKPVGLVTTHRDPQGRPTVFDKLPDPLPRVISVGRLDLNSEGLLLLTNDGELARALELPSSGWVRRYRARALGHTTQARLDALKDGTTVDGVIYGPIEATLDKVQDKADGRANVWITIGITEGKNREVRKVLESIGLKVNRLIRLAYGPFQLGNLEPGDVEEVGPRVIRELLSGMIDPRNLPPEGASQTRDQPARGSRFSRDKTAGGAAPSAERRGGANRFADKPRRTFVEKAEYRDRDFDERPRFDGDGPARDRRPAAGPLRKSHGDKPRFDRPASGEGKAGGKSFGKPRFERAEGGEDRPRKSHGDKPRFDRSASGEGKAGGKSFGKPRFERVEGGEDRPRKSYGGKPRFDRSASGEGKAGGKSFGKPRFERAEGGEDRPRKSYGDKPRFDRSASGGDRPRKAFGGKPSGDTPRGGGGFRSTRPAGAKPFDRKPPRDRS